MAELQNDLFLRALLREPIERTPVWIMRQAGRYLPEYREVRAQAGDFMSLCRNPELACEVTMQPLRRFKLDAAILFSDILTVPDALGLGLYFEAGEGPKFERPVRTAAEIKNLPVPDVADDLGYVFDAVRTIRKELDGRVPLIGFAGSPWTVGTYMVEGGSSRDFKTIKGLAAEDPAALDMMLDTVATTTTDYLNAQVDAGAQAIMIFDTWGAALERDDYRRFSLDSMQKIVDGLTRERDGRTIPVILFTKGAGPLLTDMVGTVAMRSVSTGRPILPLRVATSKTRSRYRATSIRQRCARRPRSFARGWRIRWPVTVVVRDMYSTSATALRRISTPTILACWSTRCTSSARNITKRLLEFYLQNAALLNHSRGFTAMRFRRCPHRRAELE